MLDPRIPNFVFPSLRDRVAIITGRPWRRRPPRTQMLVPPFFWRGFFFGPFSTTVARGLGEQVPVQLAVKSKAERGYARRVSPGVMPNIFGTCSSAQRPNG